MSMYDPNTPGPYHNRPYPVPPAPKKKRRIGRVLLILLSAPFVVLLGGAVVVALFQIPRATEAADNAPHVSPPATQPGPKVPQKKPVEQAPAKVPHDGTLFIGKDVKPGTYVAMVPADTVLCYTARLKDTDDELSSIIANKVGEPGTQIVVTVKASDYALEVRCGGAKWTRR